MPMQNGTPVQWGTIFREPTRCQNTASEPVGFLIGAMADRITRLQAKFQRRKADIQCLLNPQERT